MLPCGAMQVHGLSDVECMWHRNPHSAIPPPQREYCTAVGKEICPILLTSSRRKPAHAPAPGLRHGTVTQGSPLVSQFKLRAVRWRTRPPSASVNLRRHPTQNANSQD